jgi:hypothetical protein
MVFNTTFNNISAISWQSVLLVEETGVSGVNHAPVAIHWQILSHNVLSSTPCVSGIQTHNFCWSSFDFYYYMCIEEKVILYKNHPSFIFRNF